jgi:cobalt-zinc-cadmium efflux system membrane fusion protein
MINRTVILFVLTALFLLACSGGGEKKEQHENRIKDSFLNNVQTIRVELSAQDQELILTGKVECNPEKVVNYTPLINGVVDRIYFSLGDRVQKGQNMLDIRSTELSALQSEKISLETEEKGAERELRTAQSMYNDGMLSESELLEAQGKLKQAQAALNKVKADIAVYGIQKADGTFSVKAPIAGHVIERNVSSGNTISEGSDPLFTIADLSTVWILVNVYAGNLQFVREGMDVEITSLSYPEEVFNGKINSIPQVFDPEERVLKARIVMQNTDLKLKPEMSVVVKLKNSNPTKCVAVPSDALIFDDDRYFVVVKKSEGNFEIKEVILQGHNNKTTYISSGLSEGEDVVIKNQLLVYFGLKGI